MSWFKKSFVSFVTLNKYKMRFIIMVLNYRKLLYRCKDSLTWKQTVADVRRNSFNAVLFFFSANSFRYFLKWRYCFVLNLNMNQTLTLVVLFSKLKGIHWHCSIIMLKCNPLEQSLIEKEKEKPFNPVTGVCRLCLLEVFILMFDEVNTTLNTRGEYWSSCPHRRKYLLSNC